MEWNCELSIYKRLEGIRERSQYPSRGKQSIWIDRSTATRQSANNGDHSPISGSELAPRRAQMWYYRQWGASRWTHQGTESHVAITMWSMRNVGTQIYIQFAWLCPRLWPVIDRPICERLGIQAHCHCKNFLTSMQTLCILCRPISWMMSPFLDDWLVSRSLIVPWFGPSINSYFLNQCFTP